MTLQKKGVFLEKAKKETSLKQDVELFQERHLQRCSKMEAIYATFANQKLSQNLLARWSCSSVKKLPILLKAKRFG